MNLIENIHIHERMRLSEVFKSQASELSFYYVFELVIDTLNNRNIDIVNSLNMDTVNGMIFFSSFIQRRNVLYYKIENN